MTHAALEGPLVGGWEAAAAKLDESTEHLSIGSEVLPNGLAPLVPLLSSSRLPPLISLEVSGAMLGGASAAELRALAGVRVLRLRNNRLGDDGASRLAEALGVQAGPLEELDLAANGIGDAGAAALAEMLTALPLQVLELERNVVAAEGAQALAAALDRSALASLGLAGTLVGAGATALAEALKANTSLTKLDLRAAKLSAPGAVALAGAVEVNTALLDVSLQGNALGDEGTCALADALAANTTLTPSTCAAWAWARRARPRWRRRCR